MPAPPHVHRWDVAAPRGLLHIVHGMAEHGARYGRLAAALNAAGYTVWAHDHRGHGGHEATGGDTALRGHFGDSGGWEALIADTWTVSQALQATSPPTPLLLFAHSMGSFVAQALIGRHSEAYRAVVLCGSNGPPGALERAATALARLERRMRGGRTPSRWLQQIVFSTYNREFAPARTTADWLSRDTAEVDAYLADPLCGFPLTTQAWVDFLEGKAALGAAQHVSGIAKGLPLRLIAGGRDAVGEMGRGVERLYAMYVSAGLSQVSLQLYPDARHELANEINRDAVTRDLIAWLDARVG